LLWGNAAPQVHEKEQAAAQLCEHYISRKVSGVFFAPVEFSTNRFPGKITGLWLLSTALASPIVLLDRCLEPYPQRSKYDLVGIDNRRTGYSGD
jgi:DNA-binding LacI/PurR family transcriptional regulator